MVNTHSLCLVISILFSVFGGESIDVVEKAMQIGYSCRRVAPFAFFFYCVRYLVDRTVGTLTGITAGLSEIFLNGIGVMC